MGDIADLVPDLDGQVVQPGDSTYEMARRVWNAMVDRRPAAIVECASTADVARTIRAGHDQGFEIGVRCGGHSVLGLPVADGGLMIDLSPMGSVRVDPERRRAWVQGGALLGALDRASQEYGLATTAGNVSHTGVGGLTLGGGMGWLARQVGLSCDNVASFEVVTADGDVVRASGSENADLFWGLRGGGGNFGVVTEFEFVLHPVGTRALIADMFFRPEGAAPAFRHWRDLIALADRRATLTAWVGTVADPPHLPPDLHGQPLASVGYVWIGDPAEGRQLLPTLRDTFAPAAERVAEVSYLDLQTMDDTPEGHAYRRYWKGHYLRQLSDEAIAAFLSQGLDHAPDADEASILPAASFQSYGGAIADIRDHETAFSQRDAIVEFVAAARWLDPAEDERRIAAARRYGARMEPFASGAYVNVLTDEGQAGVRRAYSEEKLSRLTTLKDRFDPSNVFRLNHNIPPSRQTT